MHVVKNYCRFFSLLTNVILIFPYKFCIFGIDLVTQDSGSSIFLIATIKCICILQEKVADHDCLFFTPSLVEIGYPASSCLRNI